jgi:hypothetical protein
MRWTPAQVDELLALEASGVPVDEIARRLHCSRSEAGQKLYRTRHVRQCQYKAREAHAANQRRISGERVLMLARWLA